MAILLLFAFLAGIATIFSPCVLPALPILLSAGVAQGRWRPLGIIIGMVLSFAFFTLSLTSLIQLFDVSPNMLRQIAVVIIIIFGLILIFPYLGNWFAKTTSSLSATGSAIQQQTAQSNGFFSGFMLGIALGLVWTPCAGPILASIITLVATHKVTLDAILLTLAYSIGAGLPMLLIAYGSQYLVNSTKALARYAETIRKIFGILMILTALIMATSGDVALEQYIIKYVPVTNIDDHPKVIQELKKIREIPLSPTTTNEQTLSYISKAPELKGIADWINTLPLTLEQLHGKVVLIDFWTYSCINCVRTLPYITHWYDTYKNKGFVVIGVHTPEFGFEKDLANVKEATKRFHIHYPVALDNQYKTWQAYQNLYWPAHYLIDQQGMIREVHFGEGDYSGTENAIRTLLHLPPLSEKEKLAEIPLPQTPETYLGYQRAENYMPQIHLQPEQTATYEYEGGPQDDEVGIKGSWFAEPEAITAKGDDNSIELNFMAGQVFLVAGGASSEPITLLLDGKPLPQKYFTQDMDSKGQILVKEPRHYALISLGNDYGRHLLTIHIPKGIEAYVFTFG